MPTPARPHILLITTDQQRFDALGINGNQLLESPNLDHLAAFGTNFRRCYVTCPVCIPARRTLLSGQHPVTHGLRRYQDGLDWDPPFTLPGLLGEAGYQTQLFDLARDPGECRDLSGDISRLEPLRDRMEARIRDAGGVDYNRSDLLPCENQLPTVFST